MEEGGDIDHGLAGGRFATETEDGAPFAVGERVKAAAGTILHGPIKLQVRASRAWRRRQGVDIVNEWI